MYICSITMRFSAPHPIPYQGSKRRLAAAILSFIPKSGFKRLIEPFAGSAAITLAAAQKNLFKEYIIADVLKPLTGIWSSILNDPTTLSTNYGDLWHSQFKCDPIYRYNTIRSEFNQDHDPAKLLFLLARCVKNAVRFSSSGQFNQSADRRRQGMRPETMAKEIHAAHKLLSGRCEVYCGDFREILKSANSTDFVYMDPPYQGTSEGRDSRYIKGVERNDMLALLKTLNENNIEYVLSYDGQCGNKVYGEPLPPSLHAQHILLDVGRSSQATLNGSDAVTLESVYLSKGLSDGDHLSSPISLKNFTDQSALFT